MTLLESPGTPVLPARANQRCLLSSFFTIWPFSEPSMDRFLDEEPLGLLLLPWQGLVGKPEPSHITCLPPFPLVLVRTHSSDGLEDLSELCSYQWKQILFSIWSQRSAFLTTSQVMLMLLACRQLWKVKIQIQHTLLSKLFCCFAADTIYFCNLHMNKKNVCEVLGAWLEHVRCSANGFVAFPILVF